MKLHHTDTLNDITTRWWAGPDPGRQVGISVEMYVPTHRDDGDVLELFLDLLGILGGGFEGQVTVESL